jgi:hypothetical protein
MDTQSRFPGDDHPVSMTVDERTAWAYLGIVTVTSGTYFALMITRALAQPIERISWVGPLLWTIGLSVTGTVVTTVVSTVVGVVRDDPGSCGQDAETHLSSDVRDKEINRRGERASAGVLGTGLGAGLVLAMLDADAFWMGNLLFLFGTIGAIVQAATKIRLYRQGF